MLLILLLKSKVILLLDAPLLLVWKVVEQLEVTKEQLFPIILGEEFFLIL